MSTLLYNTRLCFGMKVIFIIEMRITNKDEQNILLLVAPFDGLLDSYSDNRMKFDYFCIERLFDVLFYALYLAMSASMSV